MASNTVISPANGTQFIKSASGAVTIPVRGRAVDTSKDVIENQHHPGSTTEETINNIRVRYGDSAFIVASNPPGPWEGNVLAQSRTYDWWADVETRESGEITILVEWDEVTVRSFTNDPNPVETSTPNSTELHVTVQVDNAPVISASLPQGDTYECPAPGNTLPVVVSGSATDDRGVTSVVVGLDPQNLNNQATPQGSWASWTATVHLPAELREHRIYAKAVDNSGNTSELTPPLIVTLVDRTPPVLTIAALPPDLLYDDSPIPLPVRGTAVDDVSGVDKVLVSL